MIERGWNARKPRYGSLYTASQELLQFYFRLA